MCVRESKGSIPSKCRNHLGYIIWSSIFSEVVTVEQISQFFEHPLILLLAGGGISVGLGTWLTHWFEDRRKEREIKVEHDRKELETKVDLLSKMAEEITNRYGNALFYGIYKQQKFTQAERNTIIENDWDR